MSCRCLAGENRAWGAVPADGYKIPVTCGISLRRELHAMSRMGGWRNFQRETCAAQAIDRRRRKFATPAAAGRRIHHREELRFQNVPQVPDAWASTSRRFYALRFDASTVRRRSLFRVLHSSPILGRVGVMSSTTKRHGDYRNKTKVTPPPSAAAPRGFPQPAHHA